MSRFKLVPDYFLRKGWNETWHYPSTGSLIALDKDFPALSPFYFSWETNYVPLHIISFSRTHYWLGPFFSAVYLFFIFFGPKLMENRKPFDLKTSLKYWNLFLAVFSFWGAIRTLPHLLYYIWKVGFFTTLCTPPVWGFGAGAAGFWTMLFVYSKVRSLHNSY